MPRVDLIRTVQALNEFDQFDYTGSTVVVVGHLAYRDKASVR